MPKEKEAWSGVCAVIPTKPAPPPPAPRPGSSTETGKGRMRGWASVPHYKTSLSEAQGEGVMGDVPGEPTSYRGRPVTPRGRTGFMYNRAD